jgi:tRNA(Ile)-lysidine synthase
LAAYLVEIGQPFREDATNAERRFTRNRLRHELLPDLAERYNANVVDAILRLSRLAGEAQDVIDVIVADLLRRAASFDGDRMTLNRSQLVGQPRYLVRELFVAAWRRQGWPEQAMGFSEWESLADAVLVPETTSGSLARMLPGGIAVQCRPDGVALQRG